MNAARVRMRALEAEQRGLPVGARRRELRRRINREIDMIAHAFVRLRDAGKAQPRT
jgi:hypothetical protein